MINALRQQGLFALVLTAAAILLVTMGIRQSMGLFVQPISQSTGLGIVSISFALAIAQLCWGAVQPVAGAMADKYGAKPVLLGGLWLLALGCALLPFMPNDVGLVLSLGILMAAGSGASSFSVLIGVVAQQVPAHQRGSASGIINAGGSLGQFVFAPLSQLLIKSVGWAGALWGLALAALVSLPLVSKLTRQATPHAASAAHESMGRTVSTALGDRSYLLLNLGFFTCGFHIAFLVTHLPGEVALCGMPAEVASWALAIIGLSNVLGSLYAGACVNRYQSKYVLAAMYGSRALLVACYLFAPKTALTFYLFAAGLGFTWLATVPPTAALVGKLFGTRYLATLFGLALFTHQIGGFLGAWLGGIAIAHTGDYQWMWYADIVLAAIAALANLPIREQPLPATAPA